MLLDEDVASEPPECVNGKVADNLGGVKMERVAKNA